MSFAATDTVKYKGLEADICLECLKNSMEDTVGSLR